MAHSVTNFSLDVPNISKLTSFSSQTVFATAWKVCVKKRNNGIKDTLGLYLMRGGDQMANNCSYVAFASFKLLSHKSNVKPLEYDLSPSLFDKIGSSWGNSAFINWNDLIDPHNGYVNNNSITFLVQITVIDPKFLEKCNMVFENSEKTDCYAKYDLTIRNIKHLMLVASPTFELKKSKGILNVYKYNNHLGIYLRTVNREPFNCMMLVKLLSMKGENKSIIQFDINKIEKFISWNELLRPENGFVTHKSITLEVSLMEKSTFQLFKNFLQTTMLNVSIPRFSIEIPRVSKLDEKGICSPEVLIRGVPWQIQVCKKLYEGKQSLMVYLYCNKDDTHLNWSYVASFTTNLVPFSDDGEAVEHHYSPNMYDSTYGYGDPLILWNDLFDESKSYVKNDSITLDVEIYMADPIEPNKSELIFDVFNHGARSNRHKYQLKVKNIQSLLAVKSTQFIFENIRWHFIVFKHENHLGVRLITVDKSFTLQLLVRVLSAKQEHSVEIVQKEYFSPNDDLYTCNILSWDELLKPENEFVNNDSVTLKVDIISPNQDETVDRDFYEPSAPKRVCLEKNECSICLESRNGKSVSTTRCGHVFCTPCITKTLKDCPSCPLCRKPAKFKDLRYIYLD